ncbi:MAG TPA: 30S ribosomal protein S20 [Bacillota bacterium]|nr:30S ribosomal protein S20 [Bacillota bacterium]
MVRATSQKHARQADKRRQRNRVVKSKVKNAVRQFVAAAEANAADVASALRHAVSQLDRAARKRIIHPNAAARRKSRLMSRQASGAKSAKAMASASAAKGRWRRANSGG